MPVKKLIFFSLMSLLISCNRPLKQANTPAQPTTVRAANCYAYIKDKDTVRLKTTDVNGTITGTLAYNFYEKDKNSGTISGQIKGELLIAEYVFMSEGRQSVRQVVFKKNGEGLLEGYGDMEDKSGKSMFKNIDSLTFNDSIILGKVMCEE